MNIFKIIKNFFSISNPTQEIIDLWGGGVQSKAGVNVTELNALQSTAVYACVRVLAEAVASLPFLVYRRLPAGGKTRAPEHPLFKILHHRPNPLMTSFELRETLTAHVTLWGNAYAEIERNNANIPIALWPLLPNKMRVEGEEQVLKYFYTLPQGKEVQIPAENIFHLRGLSANGFLGQSVIGFAREAIGLSLGTEEFGSRFFSNNAVPGGVLQHPGRLSKEGRDNLQKSFKQEHEGLSKAHRMAILEEGMEYKMIGIPGKDAQFLETRKFQVNEIARIYRVPPHLIGDLERATFSNVEQQNINFVVHTMRAWFVRWEQAILRDLFEEEESEIFFAEFLVDGLLRGDAKSRNEAYAIQRQWGIINADEWREMENKNPQPNGQGKVYIVPVNYAPATSIVNANGSNGKDLTSENLGEEREGHIDEPYTN